MSASAAAAASTADAPAASAAKAADTPPAAAASTPTPASQQEDQWTANKPVERRCQALNEEQADCLACLWRWMTCGGPGARVRQLYINGRLSRCLDEVSVGRSVVGVLCVWCVCVAAAAAAAAAGGADARPRTLSTRTPPKQHSTRA